MFKIQTFNKIAEVGLSKFPEWDYEISDNFSDPDGIILRSQKLHDMEFAETVKAIARAGAGVNNIPVDKCSERGIVVFNTPGANANAVKELGILSLLLASRKVIQGINWAKNLVGNSEDVAKDVEKGKSNFKGPEIKGKTLGVIGLGAIGAMLANAAFDLGMNVIGYDPYMSVGAAWELSSSVQRAENLNTIFSECDYISVHVPLGEKTKGMINKEALAMMKDGVRLINMSRGGLINNDDVKEALQSGKVAAYVTDFPDEKLLSTENVIGIPHLGASTPESEDNCAVMAAEQLKDFLDNGNIKNSVNFPEAILARGEGTVRLAVFHRNVPNMVGQMTAILAENSLNIVDMLNKSKTDLAYTMIDIEGNALPDAVQEKLASIEGMIKIRVI